MKGVIFMTALVPTIGHKRLIDFGMNFMLSQPGDDHRLIVIVSSRSFEPSVTADRVDILRSAYQGTIVEFIDHRDDQAPQKCVTDEDWEYWTSMIPDVDFVLGSEKYCHELANRMSALYIPCDPNREVNGTIGSEVRSDPLFNYRYMMLEWVKAKQTTVIIFGQESVGKTTLSQSLSRNLNTPYRHEWARPYLEEIGADLTPEKMLTIVHGQRAVEQIKSNDLIIIHDTDLLSTLGYYTIMDLEPPKILLEYVEEYRNDRRLYLIPSDEDVPFEPDQLRYGGDKRQSTMSFWIDILDRYNISYKILTGSRLQRLKAAQFFINEYTKMDELMMFKRD
jgi:HTH-type transcriptional regulator, transcriptional repressor of NAD biosynthesis genes